MPEKLSVRDDWATQLLKFGNEKQPILVIDNFHAESERLLKYACAKESDFEPATSNSYPGVRIKCPESYSDFIRESFKSLQVRSELGIDGEPEVMSCYFSIITTPEDELKIAQKIPHFDAANNTCFALIHYLCDDTFGGTNFYRHNSTAYEYIDPDRYMRYQRQLVKEIKEYGASNVPYIGDDFGLFRPIGSVAACWNRAAIYPGKILHTGSIPEPNKLNSNPAKGRLTTTSIVYVK